MAGLRAVRDEELRDVEALERAGGFGGGHFGQRELARREIEPCDPGPVPARIHGDEQAVALGLEQVGIGDRARRDDAQHLALDRPFARRRVADLLADRDRFAQLHELREVTVDRVVRHAGHRDGRACRLAARRQRDVEKPGRALRVVEEELVEIAHPVEEQLVRMLRLRAEVLLHHRRVLRRQVFAILLLHLKGSPGMASQPWSIGVEPFLNWVQVLAPVDSPTRGTYTTIEIDFGVDPPIPRV